MTKYLSTTSPSAGQSSGRPSRPTAHAARSRHARCGHRALVGARRRSTGSRRRSASSSAQCRPVPDPSGSSVAVRTHGECRRPSTSARSKTTRCVGSCTVRTMRSRFDRANGPTCAWSSTFHVRVPSVGVTSSTSCTRSIHAGYADRSSTRANARSGGPGTTVVRSICMMREPSTSVDGSLSRPEGPRQQRTARREQTVEVIGFVERRCPRAHVSESTSAGPRGRRSDSPALRRSRRAPVRVGDSPEPASAPRRSCSPTARSRGGARCSTPRRRGRQWRAKEVQFGITEIVERPASGHDHRVRRDADTGPLHRAPTARATGRSRTRDPRRACRRPRTHGRNNRVVRTGVPSPSTLRRPRVDHAGTGSIESTIRVASPPLRHDWRQHPLRSREDLMIRLLIRVGIALLGAAIGLLVAAVVLGDNMTLDGPAFVSRSSSSWCSPPCWNPSSRRSATNTVDHRHVQFAHHDISRAVDHRHRLRRVQHRRFGHVGARHAHRVGSAPRWPPGSCCGCSSRTSVRTADQRLDRRWWIGAC